MHHFVHFVLIIRFVISRNRCSSCLQVILWRWAITVMSNIILKSFIWLVWWSVILGLKLTFSTFTWYSVRLDLREILGEWWFLSGLELIMDVHFIRILVVLQLRRIVTCNIWSWIPVVMEGVFIMSRIVLHSYFITKVLPLGGTLLVHFGKSTHLAFIYVEHKL